MAKKQDGEQVVLGKTPTGKIVAETPVYSAPGAPRQFLGVYGEWLGDPDRRYGKLTSSRKIPAHTKIEMLGDPIIGLCQAYVGSMLVQANRVIECTDKEKLDFFEAMFRAWEREFYLQASMAVAKLARRMFDFLMAETSNGHLRYNGQSGSSISGPVYHNMFHISPASLWSPEYSDCTVSFHVPTKWPEPNGWVGVHTLPMYIAHSLAECT